MATKKKSTPSVRQNDSGDKKIFIAGSVSKGVVIAGNNNTVNQTFVQKVFQFFKSNDETLDQRNRRILLGHVENAWIKGVLDASLHGAALLDLGIKEDPEAVTKYPWAIKKESTDETLPTGTSMLEIFDNIGMGRSLLILGAPGSGKTTMLLELARQLIERARQDATEPIPMVFNLASWTEKLTLADWLAQELNKMYLVPKKTAPDWVKGNKLLLLLDGLDEVQQETRVHCVEAINTFRKEHGLTSLAVCSRSQDYGDLKTKLFFEGAIEVQPLTQKQIAEFFNCFGKEMAGIKQIFKKDSALREMAETPLFLSIMAMAYRDKQDIEILASKDMSIQREHLFGTYIERMFERPRLKDLGFKRQDVLHWLSWLATKMIEHNQIPYLLENMQPSWLGEVKRTQRYKFTCGMVSGLAFGLVTVPLYYLFTEHIGWRTVGLIATLGICLIFGLFVGSNPEIKMVDQLKWSWEKSQKGLLIGLASGMLIGFISEKSFGGIRGINLGVIILRTDVLIWEFSLGFVSMLVSGLSGTQIIDKATYTGQRLKQSFRNGVFATLVMILVFGIIGNLIYQILDFPIFALVGLLSGRQITQMSFDLTIGPIFGLGIGLFFGLRYGITALIQHYTLRSILIVNKLLSKQLIPFLDYCVDLIFLRRVGGGYIFVHRLLMEHFAEMYKE
jgi:hypothetical protein